VKKNITITFEPLGRKARADAGKTVFDTARRNGVGIRSECGGKGTCGKCKILVSNSHAVSLPSDSEKKNLSSEELGAGYRLACLTTANDSLVVMIPQESRIEARRIQVFGLERHVKVDPNIRKFYLTLPKPTLEDARPDFERLADCLKKQSDSDFEIKHDVLRSLPSLLRRAEWRVTAIVRDDKKVIGFEAGNTLDDLYGLAIDAGTSKIVVYAVDLKNGRTLGTGSIENPQMMYGEDIISRIAYVSDSERNLKHLQSMVVSGVNEALLQACKEANISWKNAYEAVFVGNTAMHHLFYGIQPKYVALSPYVPVTGSSVCAGAKELGIKINSTANVYSLEIIGGFVGPDAIADALATGIYETDEMSLLLDIGTNTEVFLGNENGMLCCSCASGPAFEGVHIKHGVKAAAGAIEKVTIEPSFDVEYETINGSPPIGICGTGIIDVTAEMLKNGIIDANGRFVKELKSRWLERVDGEYCFVVVPKEKTGIGTGIVITQKDVNEIQLAKAAIFTGCSILMRRMKLSRKEIDRVFIAGAFGTRINPENAKVIGLVPDVSTVKIRFVGNTAIAGAKMALISGETKAKTKKMKEKTVYVELGADPDFKTEFSKSLLIPHKELERFPFVSKVLGRH
jgi:uncharacterized 2Fe-2S/4Fe-4S cluster protein (DUF4445 family)